MYTYSTKPKQGLPEVTSETESEPKSLKGIFFPLIQHFSQQAIPPVSHPDL